MPIEESFQDSFGKLDAATVATTTTTSTAGTSKRGTALIAKAAAVTANAHTVIATATTTTATTTTTPTIDTRKIDIAAAAAVTTTITTIMPPTTANARNGSATAAATTTSAGAAAAAGASTDGRGHNGVTAVLDGQIRTLAATDTGRSAGSAAAAATTAAAAPAAAATAASSTTSSSCSSSSIKAVTEHAFVRKQQSQTATTGLTQEAVVAANLTNGENIVSSEKAENNIYLNAASYHGGEGSTTGIASATLSTTTTSTTSFTAAAVAVAAASDIPFSKTVVVAQSDQGVAPSPPDVDGDDNIFLDVCIEDAVVFSHAASSSSAGMVEEEQGEEDDEKEEENPAKGKRQETVSWYCKIPTIIISKPHATITEKCDTLSVSQCAVAAPANAESIMIDETVNIEETNSEKEFMPFSEDICQSRIRPQGPIATEVLTGKPAKAALSRDTMLTGKRLSSSAVEKSACDAGGRTQLKNLMVREKPDLLKEAEARRFYKLLQHLDTDDNDSEEDGAIKGGCRCSRRKKPHERSCESHSRERGKGNTETVIQSRIEGKEYSGSVEAVRNGDFSEATDIARPSIANTDSEPAAAAAAAASVYAQEERAAVRWSRGKGRKDDTQNKKAAFITLERRGEAPLTPHYSVAVKEGSNVRLTIATTTVASKDALSAAIYENERKAASTKVGVKHNQTQRVTTTGGDIAVRDGDEDEKEETLASVREGISCNDSVHTGALQPRRSNSSIRSDDTNLSRVKWEDIGSYQASRKIKMPGETDGPDKCDLSRLTTLKKAQIHSPTHQGGCTIVLGSSGTIAQETNIAAMKTRAVGVAGGALYRAETGGAMRTENCFSDAYWEKKEGSTSIARIDAASPSDDAAGGAGGECILPFSPGMDIRRGRSPANNRRDSEYVTMPWVGVGGEETDLTVEMDSWSVASGSPTKRQSQKQHRPASAGEATLERVVSTGAVFASRFLSSKFPFFSYGREGADTTQQGSSQASASTKSTGHTLLLGTNHKEEKALAYETTDTNAIIHRKAGTGDDTSAVEKTALVTAHYAAIDGGGVAGIGDALNHPPDMVQNNPETSFGVAADFVDAVEIPETVAELVQDEDVTDASSAKAHIAKGAITDTDVNFFGNASSSTTQRVTYTKSFDFVPAGMVQKQDGGRSRETTPVTFSQRTPEIEQHKAEGRSVSGGNSPIQSCTALSQSSRLVSDHGQENQQSPKNTGGGSFLTRWLHRGRRFSSSSQREGASTGDGTVGSLTTASATSFDTSSAFTGISMPTGASDVSPASTLRSVIAEENASTVDSGRYFPDGKTVEQEAKKEIPQVAPHVKVAGVDSESYGRAAKPSEIVSSISTSSAWSCALPGETDSATTQGFSPAATETLAGNGKTDQTIKPTLSCSARSC